MLPLRLALFAEGSYSFFLVFGREGGVIQAPGMAFDELRRDSATRIAGFVTRRGLVMTYGLTEAQADEFFKQPTVVRMNIEGTATHLEAAQLVFGLRIVGD